MNDAHEAALQKMRYAVRDKRTSLPVWDLVRGSYTGPDKPTRVARTAESFCK
jgi:hypothetical protein